MYLSFPAVFLLSLLVSTALAQEPPAPPDLEPVPDGSLEPQADQDQELEPEVTIIRREEGFIEEYRIHGKLYMVRIVPTKGLPYYLIDQDGDGNLETRRNELDPNAVVPNWVIFSW